jgi:hypothetical protein
MILITIEPPRHSASPLPMWGKHLLNNANPPVEMLAELHMLFYYASGSLARDGAR